MPASPQRGYGQTELRLSIGLLRGAMPAHGQSQLAACLPLPVSRSCLRLRSVALAYLETKAGRKSGFSARARARAEPLDKVFGKWGISASWGLPHSGEGQGRESSPVGSYPKGKAARALGLGRG